MAIDGIVKERVEFDESHALQQGIGAYADDEGDEDWDRLLLESYERARASGEIGPEVTLQQWGTLPGSDETREEFLQSLRDAHAECLAGRGVPAEEFFAQLDAEFGFDTKPGK